MIKIKSKDIKKKKSKEYIETLKKSVKEHPVKWILGTVGTFYVSGFIVLVLKTIVKLPQIISKEIENPLTLNPLVVFKNMFLTPWGYLILLILVVGGLYIWQYVIKPRIKIDKGDYDERGFKYKDVGTYGTSKAEYDPKQLNDVLDCDPVGKSDGIIIGKPYDVDTTGINENTDINIKNAVPVITARPDKVFKAKSKKDNWTINEIINNKVNLNMAVFGASGTMKSRTLRSMIFQAVKREESMVVTDPKGEMYEDTALMLEKNGYNVKVFDLVHQEHSDSWGCLQELIDENGEVDSVTAKIFADTIIMNATNEVGYWTDNNRSLLKAVCLLVAEDKNAEKSMGKVYDLIASTTIEQLDALFDALPANDVAKRAYSIFDKCTDQVKGQIRNGLGITLDVFQDDKIRNITTSKEIDLEKPLTEKCAYFVITSDQHNVFDFLATVFYTMMFIKLVEKADKLRAKNIKTKPVNMFLDEFPNIGQIPNFNKKISTVRSRGINITLIFQNIVQLQNRYPYGAAEEILGNCDITVFLGCTDETTAKYISDKTGIATIEVSTQNTEYARDVAVFNQDTSYHEVVSSGQRKVMNPDEILRLPNTDEIIFVRGRKPLIAKKYDYTLHPMASQLQKISIEDHIPKWKQDMIDEKAERDRILEERRAKREKAREEEMKQQAIEEAEKAQHEKDVMSSFVESFDSSQYSELLTPND